MIQTKASVDHTNVKVDETNAKVDKTSAEIIILRQEVADYVNQVRSQVKTVIEEVTDMKDDIATIREDTKKAKVDIMQYVNDQLDERFAKMEERQTGPSIAQKKQVEATPEVMMIKKIPSVSPPQENPSTDFNQPLPKEVAAYLTESSEDEKLVTSVQ